MKVLGIITARGGSKRVPGKNIYPIDGKPLIWYCIQSAKKAKNLTRLVLSTDDESIAEIGREEGVEVLMRPAELATDSTPSLDVIVHVVREMDRKGFACDAVMTIQPPHIFMTPDNIDNAIDALDNNPAADSVTTVRREPWIFHPYNARKIMDDGMMAFMFPEEKKKYFNSQSAPPVYFFGNLVLTRRKTLLEKNHLFGEKSFPSIISEREAFDIDTEEDIELAEFLVRKKKEK